MVKHEDTTLNFFGWLWHIIEACHPLWSPSETFCEMRGTLVFRLEYPFGGHWGQTHDNHTLWPCIRSLLAPPPPPPPPLGVITFWPKMSLLGASEVPQVTRFGPKCPWAPTPEAVLAPQITLMFWWRPGPRLLFYCFAWYCMHSITRGCTVYIAHQWTSA